MDLRILLLCWVLYAALGILGAQCSHSAFHSGEKLLLIKGEGYLTAAWNQDRGWYNFQLVYVYIKKSALVLSHHQSGNSLALREVVRRLILRSLPDQAIL